MSCLAQYGKLYTVDYLGNVCGGKPVRYVNLPIEELKRYARATIEDGDAVWFGCDVGHDFCRTEGILDPAIHDYELLFGTQVDVMDKVGMSRALLSHLTLKGAARLGCAHAARPVAHDARDALDRRGLAHADHLRERRECDGARAGLPCFSPRALTHSPQVEKPALKWRVQNSWGEKSGKKVCVVCAPAAQCVTCERVQGYLVMSDAWFSEWVYQVVVDKSVLPAEVLAILEQEATVLPAWDPMGSLAQ